MIGDNVTVDWDPRRTELVALRNRMDAAESALAEAERNIALLLQTVESVQTFLLRCTTAANPGMGGK